MAKKEKKNFCVSAGSPGFFSDSAKPQMRIYRCVTTRTEANRECRNLRGAGKKCKVIDNSNRKVCLKWGKKRSTKRGKRR